MNKPASNIRSSAVWKKFEPKKRGKIMEKYAGRFVVCLSPNKKVLYLSDMIVGKLVHPNYIGLQLLEGGTMVGITIAAKDTGFKVDYAPTSTPNVNIPSFVKFFEAETKKPFEPGVYECIVETIDAQTVDHYDMVIFDTQDAPAKVRLNANGAH